MKLLDHTVTSCRAAIIIACTERKCLYILFFQTDEAVHERQSMKHFLQSENREKKKTVGAIIESELVKEKVVDSFKKYKVKVEQQMDKLASK